MDIKTPTPHTATPISSDCAEHATTPDPRDQVSSRVGDPSANDHDWIDALDADQLDEPDAFDDADQDEEVDQELDDSSSFGEVIIEVEDEPAGTVPASHWDEEYCLHINARFPDPDIAPPFDDVRFVIMDDAPLTSLITSCVVDGHEVAVSLDRDENGDLTVQILSAYHDITVNYG